MISHLEMYFNILIGSNDVMVIEPANRSEFAIPNGNIDLRMALNFQLDHQLLKVLVVFCNISCSIVFVVCCG